MEMCPGTVKLSKLRTLRTRWGIRAARTNSANAQIAAPIFAMSMLKSAPSAPNCFA
jgi:hypothetical protein